MMQRTTIKFVEHYGSYLKGEIATFPAGVALKIIDSGFAFEYESGKQGEAIRLKSIASAPETKHVPGPENTKDIKPKANKEKKEPAKRAPRKTSTKKNG